MTDELEIICKEAVGALSRYCPGKWMEGPRKPCKASVRIARSTEVTGRERGVDAKRTLFGETATEYEPAVH
jgi:hypothetical protein